MFTRVRSLSDLEPEVVIVGPALKAAVQAVIAHLNVNITIDLYSILGSKPRG